MLSRTLIVGAGLVILLIAFVIIKSILVGGGNGAALLTVAQDQQAIVHLTTSASQQPGISSDNLNFAVTSRLVILSQQQQLLTYAKKQSQKISPKQLALKVKPSIDAQLVTAAAATTYDSTFDNIMKSQLTDYQSALQLAYKQTKGTNGRNLLSTEYSSATLLLQQLSAVN